MGERYTIGELRRDGVHPVEHVCLALLVHVLQVTVIEVLLEIQDGLSRASVRVFHLEHSIKCGIPRQRVLSLHHKRASATLLGCHERRSILVGHWVRIAN